MYSTAHKLYACASYLQNSTKFRISCYIASTKCIQSLSQWQLWGWCWYVGCSNEQVSFTLLNERLQLSLLLTSNWIAGSSDLGLSFLGVCADLHNILVVLSQLDLFSVHVVVSLLVVLKTKLQWFMMFGKFVFISSQLLRYDWVWIAWLLYVVNSFLIDPFSLSRQGLLLHKLTGHRDVVTDVAFHPTKPMVCT